MLDIPKSTDNGDTLVIDPAIYKFRDNNLGQGRCLSIHPTTTEISVKVQNRRIKDQLEKQTIRANSLEERLSRVEDLLRSLK